MVFENADISTLTNDLIVFSNQEDLFESPQIPTFDTHKLNATIASSAHRALQVCNALAQHMLAQYKSDNEEDIQIAHVKAEHIAYDLGDSEYNPDAPKENPFEQPELAQSWQSGYDHARSQKYRKPLNTLEKRIWENGIDTDDGRSQYELCALQLYKIAVELDSGADAERAKRLAMEMCRYHEGETPSEHRQSEIDRFMSIQAKRIALSIDF